MHVQYVAQPDVQLGAIISRLLEAEPFPRQVIFVSAFVGLQAVTRFKESVANLKSHGSSVRLVLGIDMGGTSQEVLKEVCSWDVEVKIVKHRIPGHTFHPKLYSFEWDDHAEIIIGSNNITEGGLYSNYESSVRVRYDLPADVVAYKIAKDELRRFLDPDGPIVYLLTEELLNELVNSEEIPSEMDTYSSRSSRRRNTSRKAGERVSQKSLFGFEEIPTPPPLPANLLGDLLQEVRRRRKARRASRATATMTEAVEGTPISREAKNIIAPIAFYMTVPKLQGPNIPGESRIPLEAIELAPEYWGWPDEYKRAESPRTGKNRIYWNWKPKWKVGSAEMPNEVTIQDVHMYMYENSSDFRFYARPLVNAGADLGDIVRIRRIAHPDAEYECVLARQGTAEFNAWINYCTQQVRNSTRRFGYV